MDSSNPQDNPASRNRSDDVESIARSETTHSYEQVLIEPDVSINYAEEREYRTANIIIDVEPVIRDNVSSPDEPGIGTATAELAPVTVPILSAEAATKHIEWITDDPDYGTEGYDSYESSATPLDAVATDGPYEEPAGLKEEENFEFYLAGNLIADESDVRDDPFRFRERSWDSWRRLRRTILILMALATMLVVATIGGTFALSYLRHSTANLDLADPTPTVSSYSGGVVIQPAPNVSEATPAIPDYQIGVWSATNSPSGGAVKVFVRITHDVTPVAKIPVTLAVSVPGGTLRFGPTKTDSYGLATFNVTFGGVSGTPIFATANAKIGSQQLSAQTVFFPL